MRVAEEARRAQKLAKKVRRRGERMSESEGATKELAPVVGKTLFSENFEGAGDGRLCDCVGVDHNFRSDATAIDR